MENKNEKIFNLIKYLSFKLSICFKFKNIEIDEINNDILNKLLSNYKEIQIILKLNSLDTKYIYFNKYNIHNILYKEDEILILFITMKIKYYIIIFI